MHLTSRLLRSAAADPRTVDVTSREDLRALAAEWPVRSVVHLGAFGTVITSRANVPRMLDVTIDGLVNLIDFFQPRQVLYASTCAVYGNSPDSGGRPCQDDVKPVSTYGLSKAMAEMMLIDWARESGNEAVLFRLGNVIGPNCRGLITYLVRHAVKYPDGSVPARMRGGGRVIRDYVPVEYVAHLMELAASREFAPGSAPIFNIGSGRPRSNGEVAEIVKEWLTRQGYRLNIEFEPDVAPGEARQAILRTEATEKFFGVEPPDENAVRASIVEGARTNLLACLEQQAVSHAAAV